MPSSPDVEVIVSALRPLEQSTFAQSLVAFYDKAGFLTKNQLIAGSKLVGGLSQEQTKKWVTTIDDGLYIDKDEYFIQIYKVFKIKGKRSIRRRGLNLASWATVTNNGFAHERIAKMIEDGDMRPLSFDEMIEIGRKTGLCCICGRSLDDEKSIEAGIGPVCAKNVLNGVAN